MLRYLRLLIYKEFMEVSRLERRRFSDIADIRNKTSHTQVHHPPHSCRSWLLEGKVQVLVVTCR